MLKVGNISFQPNLGVLISKNHVAETGNVALILFWGIFLQICPKTCVFCNINPNTHLVQNRNFKLGTLTHWQMLSSTLQKEVWECTMGACFGVIFTKNHQKNTHFCNFHWDEFKHCKHLLSIYLQKNIKHMNMLLTLDEVWECKLRGFLGWKPLKTSKNAFFCIFS